MTFIPILMVSFLAGTVAGGVAFAGSHLQHGMSGNQHGMMNMMDHNRTHARGNPPYNGHAQMHGRMQPAEWSGMHGMSDRGGHGQMGGGMHGAMRRMLDADGDGMVTPEEAREQLQAMLKTYDADANGSLSIAEYEALHSAMIRESMVDRFQHLDADGDGQITADEMYAPAEAMSRMQRMHMMIGRSGGPATNGTENVTEDGGTSQN